MSKLMKTIFGFVLTFALALTGGLLIAGCDNSANNNNYDPEIVAVYNLAVADGYDGSFESWIKTIKGENGKGIVLVEKKSTNGLVDTYKITYSDGSFSTFDIVNGQDGEHGDKGEKGDKGDKGSKGDKGDRGDNGRNGNPIVHDEYNVMFSLGSFGEYFNYNTPQNITVRAGEVLRSSDLPRPYKSPSGGWGWYIDGTNIKWTDGLVGGDVRFEFRILTYLVNLNCKYDLFEPCTVRVPYGQSLSSTSQIPSIPNFIGGYWENSVGDCWNVDDIVEKDMTLTFKIDCGVGMEWYYFPYSQLIEDDYFENTYRLYGIYNEQSGDCPISCFYGVDNNIDTLVIYGMPTEDGLADDAYYNVSVIGEHAFFNAKDIWGGWNKDATTGIRAKRVVIIGNLYYIGYEAFTNVLEEIYFFGDFMPEIAPGAFVNCPKLHTIVGPSQESAEEYWNEQNYFGYDEPRACYCENNCIFEIAPDGNYYALAVPMGSSSYAAGYVFSECGRIGPDYVGAGLIDSRADEILSRYYWEWGLDGWV